MRRSTFPRHCLSSAFSWAVLCAFQFEQVAAVTVMPRCASLTHPPLGQRRHHLLAESFGQPIPFLPAHPQFHPRPPLASSSRLWRPGHLAGKRTILLCGNRTLSLCGDRAGWRLVPDEGVCDNAFKARWEPFLRHVARDEPFPWNLLEGAKGVQLVELALESGRTRAWIDIPQLKP